MAQTTTEITASVEAIENAAPVRNNPSLATAGAKGAADISAHITDGTPADIVERYCNLPAIAAAADYGRFDNNLVVVDTETTGLTMDADELIQIAAARVERGKVVDWYVTFVDPGRFIPEEVMRLTGISERELIGAPTPEEACTQLVEFVGDATLVAHNAAFDRGQITKHPEAACLLNNLWVDTLDLARIALPRLKSYRLIDLVRSFGTVESSHRADDDVAATCAVLRILLAGVDALDDDVLCTIAGMATPDVWPTVEVFRYFAQRHLEAKGKSFNEALARLENGGFTCKTLRRARLSALPAPAARKVDAAVVAEGGTAAGLASTLAFASPQEIADAFTPAGLVGSLYPDFEPRAEQVTMAQAVNRAFAQSENLAVEAGTGVGKSMAYLVPAVLAAKKSNITVGIATKTNTLLDQLTFHELPELAAALEAAGKPPVTYAALKGLSHYPCLRKIDNMINRGARTEDTDNGTLTSAPGMAALLSFVAQTDYDDADNLHFDPRMISRYDYTSGSAECMRRKCPYFGNGCFAHGARRRAENADIVVTNHALLFADVEAEGALLPPIRYWVVDEAHGAEEEAREAASVELRSEDLLRLAERCGGEDGTRNLFRRVARRDPRVQEYTDRVIAAGKEFAAAARAYAKDVKQLKKFCQNQRGSRAAYGEAVWLSEAMRAERTFGAVASSGKTMLKLADPVIDAADKCLAALAAVEAAADLQNEVGMFCFDMRDMYGAGEVVFGETDPRYVYSVYILQKADRYGERLCAQIIDVGGYLNRTLFERTHSVVFASATLTVGGSFDAFNRALGLNQSENSEARELQLGSSFDFDRNMTIYVPTDMPEFNVNAQQAYLEKLSQLLAGVHVATHGGLLTLFASRADMDACYEAVKPVLDDEGLVLERQKQGASIKALRDLFVNNTDNSLFALKSFWAGFDAPGETLRGVIIPKLPFVPPTDPLSRIREEREGSAAWAHYSLPAAVTDTRQAVGRLIRKADDRGIVILADSRILSKYYGATVLRSMPSQSIKKMTIAGIIADIRATYPEWAER